MLKLSATALIWFFLAFLTKAVIPDDAKPLSKEELAEFLGKTGSTLISWSKVRGFDSEYYIGRPRPPLSGEVGIYFGFAPGFPPLDRDSWIETPEARLGKFSTRWLRKLESDGSVLQGALVPIGPRNLQVCVTVKAKDESTLDKLVLEISRLPVFVNGKVPPWFQNH